MRLYPYFDTHCDTLLKLYNRKEHLDCDTNMVNLKNMSNYKCPVQVFAVFNEGDMTEADMFAAFDYIKAECRLSHGKITFAASAKTIEKNIYHNRASAMLSIEGLGNQRDFNIDCIKKYYLCGVRFISLCWNGDNMLCGGIGRNLNGLSRLGEQVLREMAKYKIIADVSHMSEKSFWDTSEVYTLPLCATHSGSRKIHNHPRNLSDEQFNQIKSSGGVCGINFYPPFLGGKNPNIDSIILHIEHFMSLGGENHIGIGADFDGVDSLPCGIEGSKDVYKLFDKLLALNYKESTVNKIAFYNFYNLIKKIEISL